MAFPEIYKHSFTNYSLVVQFSQVEEVMVVEAEEEAVDLVVVEAAVDAEGLTETEVC